MPTKGQVVFIAVAGVILYWLLKGLVSGDIKTTHDPSSGDKFNTSFSLKSDSKG